MPGSTHPPRSQRSRITNPSSNKLYKSGRRSLTQSRPSGVEIFDALAKRMLSLGLFRQAMRSLGTALEGKQLRPSEYAKRVQAARDADVQLRRIIELGRSGRVKGWQAERSKVATTPGDWADAIMQLMDMRNVFERIYRGRITYKLPSLTRSGQKSIRRHEGKGKAPAHRFRWRRFV